jgi:hypothetical protein
LEKINGLLKEVKRLDDKLLLVEVQLIESKIHMALKNIPKAKVRGLSPSPEKRLRQLSPRQGPAQTQFIALQTCKHNWICNPEFSMLRRKITRLPTPISTKVLKDLAHWMIPMQCLP